MSQCDKSSGDSDFSIASCACPLAQIPASVWKQLLRPPFRKRHPFVFWGLLLAILIASGCAVKNFAGGRVRGDCLALVNIQGPIIEAAPTLAWLREIERNDSVKGVLCRINSPGGGASASQEIYAALARLGKSRPVAVSMGATAASGGLMIGMAGERVFASPATVTGSIGVRMDIPQLQGLMEKIGVGQETLVTVPYKDAASYTHPLTPKDRAYLESVLLDMHEQFVNIVAEGRHMPLEEARELANGKIFTGQEALKLKIVDELGGQDAAQAWLCERTGVPQDKKLLEKPATRARLTELILGALELAASAFGPGDDLARLKQSFIQPAFLYQF